MKTTASQRAALIEFDRYGRRWPNDWCRLNARPNTIWALARLGLVEAREVFPSGGTQARITPAGKTLVSEMLADGVS